MEKGCRQERTNITSIPLCIVKNNCTHLFFQLFLSLNLPEVAEQMLGSELNDRLFCIWYSTFAYFNLSYECTGSLGMAIFRIMYLKVSNLLFFQEVIQELSLKFRVIFLNNFRIQMWVSSPFNQLQG